MITQRISLIWFFPISNTHTAHSEMTLFTTWKPWVFEVSTFSCYTECSIWVCPSIPCTSLRYCQSVLLEKTMAPHSSTLAWKIPWMEEPRRLQSMGSLRVGHDWATSLSLFTFHFHALEKEMASHSSVLAWRIPGTREPGGLPSVGLQSRTQLKRLSSSSSSLFYNCLSPSVKLNYFKGTGKVPSI